MIAVSLWQGLLAGLLLGVGVVLAVAVAVLMLIDHRGNRDG